MPPDPTVARQRLNALKRELTDLSAVSSEDRSVVELDQQGVGRLSRMDALQRQAIAQATERQRVQRLQRIEAAYRRLADGEYGICEECGDEIPDKRLAFDPTVHLCVNCARLSEQ